MIHQLYTDIIDYHEETRISKLTKMLINMLDKHNISMIQLSFISYIAHTHLLMKLECRTKILEQ
jgi:hypothetical protein